MASREWSTTEYYTRSLDYTIRRRKRWAQVQKGQPCKMMVVSMSDNNLKLEIPCLMCFNEDYDKDEYLNNFKSLVANKISREFDIDLYGYANDVAQNFVMSILEPAISTRNSCTQYRYRYCNHRRSPPRKYFTLIEYVEIQIDRFDEEVDLPDFIEEEFEEVPLRKKPASVESVEALLKNKSIEEFELGPHRFEFGWVASDHVCVICMDEIKTRRSSLSMSCSHVFHQACLLSWLENSHVCPLCRHAMPTQEDVDYDLSNR